MATVSETPEQALARIQSMGFCRNDALAVLAFSDAGVDPDDIEPRENVLTFKAWNAKGRKVAKGARAVRVTVWIPRKPKKGDDENAKGRVFPRTVNLFHVSQTIAIDAEPGTPPDCLGNDRLVKPETYAELQTA